MEKKSNPKKYNKIIIEREKNNFMSTEDEEFRQFEERKKERERRRQELDAEQKRVSE